MNKREFIKVAGLAGIAALVAPGCAGAAEAADGNKTLLALKPPFALPELPYAADALEPGIDKMTMEIHHGKHHAGYIKEKSRTTFNICGGWTSAGGCRLQEVQVAFRPNPVRGRVKACSRDK